MEKKTTIPTILVQAYSGYRGNERPLAVLFGDKKLPVLDIIDSWISTGVRPKDAVEFGYLVRCSGGYRFKLIFSEEAGWRGEEIPGPRAVDEDK